MTDIHKKLLEAQRNMRQPVFNAKNPHFNSEFANLSEVNNCALKPCNDAGLLLTQCIRRDALGAYLETRVTDEDGESVILGEYPLTEAQAQQFGSQLTYGRRYSLSSAFCLVADSDDDGNAAQEAKPMSDLEKAQRMLTKSLYKWAERHGKTRDEAVALLGEQPLFKRDSLTSCEQFKLKFDNDEIGE